jgi:hypothetical protein
LTPEEFGRLLACTSRFYWDHFVTQVGTGLRSGELLGLQPSRVYLGQGRLEVVDVRYDAGKFGSGYRNRPKTVASIRAVPLAQLGGRQLELADAGVPGPGPVAVALGGAPLRRALAELGAGQPGDLGVHQLGDQPRDAVAQHVGVIAGQQLVDQLGSVRPSWCLLRRSLDRPTIMRPAMAEPTSNPRTLLHHSQRRDRTRKLLARRTPMDRDRRP